ncbi:TniQ family protein [Achromobacter xylosoxidans]|uniref:TniQ family protein n=1 Tax=Alcaligenes xylosoxydans xylosoxydans TaxID=85698 RepID=UPI000B0F4C22|nr:TniQ family protein [Achromobacter xylosoxidans]
MLFSDQKLGLPLPATSQIHHDESGNGYALRMADANGISFAELTGLVASPGHRYIPAKSAPLLAYLFGSSPESVRRAIPERYVTRGATRIAFMGHLFKRSYLVRHTWPQVCPLCLDEHRSAKAVWELAMVVACEAHGLELVDHCNACDRRLSWRRPSLTMCWCGHSLVELPRVAARCNAKAWSAQIAELFSSGEKRDVVEDFGFLNGMGLDMRQRLVRVCGLSAMYEGASVQPGTLVRQRSSSEMRDVVGRGLQRCGQLGAFGGETELLGDDLYEDLSDPIASSLRKRFGVRQKLRGSHGGFGAQLELALDGGT